MNLPAPAGPCPSTRRPDDRIMVGPSPAGAGARGGPAVKHGLLVHGPSGNLGDAVQSLAARRFLPRVDRLVERERLGDVAGAGPLKLIMNGWWMKEPAGWPPPPDIMPLFVSFHVTTGPARAALLSAESRAYLRRHGPIGCRDLHTASFLRDAGIDAYFSGCLTMTLPPRPRPRDGAGEVLFVDVFRSHFFETADAVAGRDRAKILQLRRAAGADDGAGGMPAAAQFARSCGLPDSWCRDVGLASALARRDSSPAEKLQSAEAMLERLAAARLVVTSRLHAALPAMALGTPCLFVFKDDPPPAGDVPERFDQGHDCTRHDPRFPGLLEQMRSLPFSRLLAGLPAAEWESLVETPPRLRADLAAAMEARVLDFLRD